jgi:Protein of unknown function (DUF3800)
LKRLFGVVCLRFSGDFGDFWICDFTFGVVMTAFELIIYCDESDDKGEFYSNFYGGALLSAKDRELIDQKLQDAKGARYAKSELKWTYINPRNEEVYVRFVEALFQLIADGKLKLRIMFTQNINQTRGLVEYSVDREFFILYYHFVKLAFGLRYCNPERKLPVNVSIYLDDVPDTKEKFGNFQAYLSSLSTFPVFYGNRIIIDKQNIVDVDSKKHIILQAVDVVLGAMQFRLNDKHKAKEPGQRRRGKRTRSKERVYKRINQLICKIRPRFNIGISTGHDTGPEDRWHHPYRHWCFVPNDSVRDLARGKKKEI